MAHNKSYQTLLLLSILIDVLLCVLLLVSLLYYFINGKQFSSHYLIGFATFFVLFIAFVCTFAYALRTHNIRFTLVSVALTVARFLCAIVIVVAWMASTTPYRTPNDEDPYEWIAHRKVYLIAFTAFYIPVFCIQLYVLNRHYSKALAKPRR
ncbi:unnamed protein product [Caenorhabditis auriculariae]|uniref:Uncharacterized protein n=1 Tax=Caenorhabditis auriculariae TaxID=2777116 RepID=A0A8S1GN20_9PELO|nr:unnamed protein product [Caenorhabditis auriculariae]